MGAAGSQSEAPALDRALLLLDRFVFASLLGLLVLVVIPFGTVEPWWISLYECASFGLGALWILQGLITGVWNVREKQLLAPLAVLVAFTFLQSVRLFSVEMISSDPFETRLVFLKLLALAINGALLLRYTATRRRMRALIHVVIGVAVASALFGIARQALQHSDTGFILPYLRRDSGFGQFVNKNHFAFLAEMGIGLATGLIFGGAVQRERLLIYVSAIALMWTGLVLTSSRGGIFSMLGQIVFLIVMTIWLRSKQRAATNRSESTIAKRWGYKSIAPAMALSVCLLAVVAASAVWLGGDVLVTRLASLPGEIKTEALEPHAGVRRREVWSATWQLIKAHPLAGSGFGAYGVAITKFHDASGKWTPEAAHNDYLELFASGGIVGVGLVVWFGFVFIKRARRQLSRRENFRRAACLGALTGIFGVVVHNVVDFGLHVTANAVVFMALVVIATRDLRAENQTSWDAGSGHNQKES
jgi:O-antigen ligase